MCEYVEDGPFSSSICWVGPLQLFSNIMIIYYPYKVISLDMRGETISEKNNG